MTVQLPANATPLVTIHREEQANVWILEMHNGEDNRLTHTMVRDALMPALNHVEREWRSEWRSAQKGKDSSKADGSGALIIIGKMNQDKFFSNGLDYANSSKDPGFFSEIYNPLVTRLLTFPLPIVAAINGHCFAGAFIMSLACDYRVMTDGKQRRAWCSMNEIHFGAPWPASLAAIARCKVSDARVLRKISIEGARFTPSEALAAGFIDVVANGGTSAEVLAAARKLASEKATYAKTGVLGLIKKEMYRHTLEDISKDYRVVMPIHADDAARAKL